MALEQRELPDDLLADILRSLVPRSLAVSRCVCERWRDVVDTRRLLRTELLPQTVHGIFIEYCTLWSTEFFSRPSTGSSISGCLDFLPRVRRVANHCNGLLLCGRYGHDYEVFLIPVVPNKPETKLDSEMLQSEWPPLSYAMQVFSSTTERWQEMSFFREGEAAGIVAEIKSDLWGCALPHRLLAWSTLHVLPKK